MVVTQWEIQCLGIPIDNRTTTEKRLKSKFGLLTMEQVHPVLCSLSDIPLLTITSMCCWLYNSHAYTLTCGLEHVGSEHRSLSSFSSGCRGRNLGLWPFGMMRHFSSVVDEREIFQIFIRYTTILNSGILKVIPFKHGTLRILGSPAAEAFALRSRPSAKNGGPTLTPQQLTGRLRTAETSNHVLFMVTWWQWPLEVVRVAVCCRESTAVDWMTLWVMTRTGWGEDLNVVYVKFILYRIPFSNFHGKYPIYSMYVVCTFATLQYTFDVSWIP